MTTPLSVYLPFNRDSIGAAFVPAKRGSKPPDATGHWLIVREQRLIVVPEGDGFRLPTGPAPSGFDGALGEPLWLGTLAGTEVWVAPIAPWKSRLACVSSPGSLGRGGDDQLPAQGPYLSQESRI